MSMESGIYEIVNKINGKRYIGQSTNVRNRFEAHKNLLNRNKHDNNHLQHAWNKYGEDNFTFKVLGYYKACLLTLMEQSFMGLYIFETELYNLAPAAGSSFGIKRTDETRRKISEAAKGRIFSEEHKRKLSESRKWRKGENSPISKLNWVKVGEIREKFKNGIKQLILAKEYKVDPSVISEIVNNKSWIENN